MNLVRFGVQTLLNLELDPLNAFNMVQSEVREILGTGLMVWFKVQRISKRTGPNWTAASLGCKEPICIECGTECFGFKRVWEGKEVNAMLQRLNRLTQDEAQTTAVHILKAVYCLVQNITVVMDGEATFSSLSLAASD